MYYFRQIVFRFHILKLQDNLTQNCFCITLFQIILTLWFSTHKFD